MNLANNQNYFTTKVLVKTLVSFFILITFSYGRALQQSALKIWGKNMSDDSNTQKLSTQKIFNHRAKMNSLSTSSMWYPHMEKLISN